MVNLCSVEQDSGTSLKSSRGHTHTLHREEAPSRTKKSVHTATHTHTTLRNDAINSRKIGRCTVLLFAYDAAGVHTLPPPEARKGVVITEDDGSWRDLREQGDAVSPGQGTGVLRVF